MTLNKIGAGYRSSNALNNDFDLIEEGFERTLDRFGGPGNHMEAPLDMNSNPMLNLPAPASPTEPMRLMDLQAQLDAVLPILNNGKVSRIGSLVELEKSLHLPGLSVYVEGRQTSGDGYQGTFTYHVGDYTSEVAQDVNQGVFVSSSPQAGAWIRAFDGPVRPEWFGGKTSEAINKAILVARVLGNLPVVGEGLYVCKETIGFTGNGEILPYLDFTDATFVRNTDYGPTIQFSGNSNGPLERGALKFGRLVDLNDSMTLTVSKGHMILDNLNFFTWNIVEIVGGLGVCLQGCATAIQEGRGSWRFGTTYRGVGSTGLYVGPSYNVPTLHGGDNAINGTIDIYCGGVYHRVGGTDGASSTIVTLTSGGMKVGDIVTQNGTTTNPYGLIPEGTTVVAVDGLAVTLSTAVNLPAGTALVFYRPALDTGMQVAASDGLWGEGFVHVIGAKENSFRFGSNRPFWNVRLKYMADFGPGTSARFEGTSAIDHSTFYSHNQYGPTVFAEGTPAFTTAVIEYDGQRSTGGFEYEGLFKASGGFQTHLSRYQAKGGYAEHQYRTAAGVLRYNEFFEEISGRLTLRAHDSSGVSAGDIWTFDPPSQMWQLKKDIQFGAVSVAELSDAKHQGYSDGTLVLCYDVRRLTSTGTLEGAGAGGLGFVVKSGSDWYLLSTNIVAQA